MEETDTEPINIPTLIQQFKWIKVSIQGVSDSPHDKLWKKLRIVMKSTNT